MSAILGLIETALYARLTGHTPLTALVGTRVYSAVAPSGTALPYLVFELVGGGEENLTRLRSVRVRYRLLGYALKHADARAVAAAADDALRGGTLSIAGWTTHYLRPDDFVRRTELIAGALHIGIGAVYTVGMSEG